MKTATVHLRRDCCVCEFQVTPSGAFDVVTVTRTLITRLLDAFGCDGDVRFAVISETGFVAVDTPNRFIRDCVSGVLASCCATIDLKVSVVVDEQPLVDGDWLLTMKGWESIA